MEIAKSLTSGVDLWLNTPQRPKEASGTSGMKAAHNGIPSFSILDGWFIEGHKKGLTGWSIGREPEENTLIEVDDEEDARDLLRKLEGVVIPAFYSSDWEKAMLGSVVHSASYFNTHMMVEEYAQRA